MENKNTNETKNTLFYEPKNIYKSADGETLDAINDFSDEYAAFLDASKTEREAVREVIARAEENGYRPYRFGDYIEEGGKYYYNNRGKSLYLFAIGSEPLDRGIKISAAHIDSPRLDLKQVPLYEDGGMGFFRTHYYGGIRKYQWTAIPLALHGTVMLASGNVIDITVGELDSDPVFYVTDLLPHLAKDQGKKPLDSAFTGEDMNILIGSVPVKDEKAKSAVKQNLINILNEKYGIKEADFLSAEICAVPSFKARDVGFDRSLLGGYGHDDRVCSFPAVRALFDTDSIHTRMVVLADKEEIGSEGVSGMQSAVFTDIIDELAVSFGTTSARIRAASCCLSADVNAAFDPKFADVFEKSNASCINNGVVMTKFTGARGKSGSSDASAEFVGRMRRLFDRNGVIWQIGELGKVDQGGGGTVAKFIAEKNIETVDLGVAVLAMHSPYEVISKADLYMTYRAFCAFMSDDD